MAQPSPTSRSESGAILIEVVIAIAVLIAGILGTLGILDAARSTAATSQRMSAADAVAQREIEAMRTQSFAGLYDCSAPVHASAPTDPRYWVTSAPRLLVQQDFRKANSQLLADVPAGGEPLFTGTCTSTVGVAPGPTPFTSGNVHGQIYRFVSGEGIPCVSTLTNDLNASLSSATGVDAASGTTGLVTTLLSSLTPTVDANIAGFCQLGNIEAKRLTVAVTVDSQPGGPGPHMPIYLSSLVSDPSAGVVNF